MMILHYNYELSKLTNTRQLFVLIILQRILTVVIIKKEAQNINV